jgi:protein SCO1/2
MNADKKKTVLIVGTLLLAGCSRAPSELPVLGQIEAFRLTAQTGRAFDSSELVGHVWVADFIFTNCPGPCPLMSKHMGELQRATADLPGVRFVSFSVDPANDTPAVLTAYGKHFLQDPNRWTFLTGDQRVLDKLAFDEFKLNHVDGSFEHSTRFVLLDGKMRIRGYYSSEEPGFEKQLERDLRGLNAAG